jgi:hypothetical protein
VKKQCFRIVIALIGFAALGITAKTQAVDQVVVNIPFEFAAPGTAVPVVHQSANGAVCRRPFAPSGQEGE